MPRQRNSERRPRNANNVRAAHATSRAGDTRRSNGNGVATPQKPAAVSARTEVGMSPASRYNSNLRILRRRDPKILSIFDQFPHACAYYFSISEQKWERMGYEGALFLFEREVEPKYGFFILNRAGMEDFIQYLIPSDILTPQGEYLCIESKESRGTSTADSGYSAPHSDRLQSTMSLWTLPTDTRESLADVMLRLLDCVQKGILYPKQYRYRPDMVVRSTFLPSSGNEDEGDYESESDEDEIYHDAMSVSASTNSVVKQALNGTQGNSNGPSELDHLFAKLAASAPTNSQEHTPAPTQTAQARQTVPSSTTANSILEMLSRSNQPPAAPQGPLSGQALLSNMFASVSNTNGQFAAQQSTLPSQNFAQFRFPVQTSTVSSPPQDMEILSPKPNNAALPQILTADVIHELMGLPSSSSRSTSCASTSEQSHGANSVQPHAQNQTRPRTPSSAGAPRSKERGYIADRGEDDGGMSEASTGFEGEQFANRHHQQDKGLGPRTLGARSSFLSAKSNGSSGSLKGDTTPRAQHGRGLEPMPSNLSLNSQKAARAVLSQSVSDALTSGESNKGTQVSTGRPMPSIAPPFLTDSEIWTQAQTSTGARDNHDGKANETDGIMELDFSDIRALDDPRLFEARGTGDRGKEKGKGRDKDKDRGRGEPTSRTKEKGKERTGASLENGPASPPAGARERQRGKPARRERERQTGTATPVSESVLSSEITSPPGKLTNGNSSSSITNSKRVPQTPITSPDLAKALLLNEIARSGIDSKSEKQSAGITQSMGLPLDKNTFMQQVLTLIHTDKSFVERLYQGYLDQA